MHKDSILAQLRAHEAELKAAGIAGLSIFGSVARGDATDSSDVDVVVRLSPEKSEGGFCLFRPVGRPRATPSGDTRLPGRYCD